MKIDLKSLSMSTAILAICVMLSLPTHAEEEESEESDVNLEQSFLDTNSAISDWFNSVTEGVDLFLAGKRMTNAANKRSTIILENSTYSREGQNLTNLTTLNVNPRLPNLEAYWNLKFTTTDDIATTSQRDRGYATQTPKDKNYAASIGLFKRMKQVRVAFQPRIELQNPLRVSHSLSGESVFVYKNLEFNPKLQFFANATIGTGTAQALNFHYHINKKYSVTFINEGQYEDKINRYSVTNGVSLGHEINDRSAISYGINFFSNNRPSYHLDAYSIGVTWSEIIYKKVLDYQLTPHIDFVRDEDYRGFVGMIFNLNVRF